MEFIDGQEESLRLDRRLRGDTCQLERTQEVDLIAAGLPVTTIAMVSCCRQRAYATSKAVAGWGGDGALEEARLAPLAPCGASVLVSTSAASRRSPGTRDGMRQRAASAPSLGGR